MTARKDRFNAYFITVTGVMAALACVSNLLRIPLGDSKLSISNAVCVLCGFLLGPGSGFLAAGIGNFLYDIFTGYGYESLITLVSKGAIAVIAALVAGHIRHKDKLDGKDYPRLLIASILAALTYVALYMLKTFVLGLTVNGLTMEATGLKMAAKLPASLTNAVFAAVVSPLFYLAVRPALSHIGVFRKM